MSQKKTLSFIVLTLACTVATVAAAAPVSIDDESFGAYRIATNELVIANGDINARGPEKIIPFGTTRFRVDCGPQQSLVITRE